MEARVTTRGDQSRADSFARFVARCVSAHLFLNEGAHPRTPHRITSTHASAPQTTPLRTLRRKLAARSTVAPAVGGFILLAPGVYLISISLASFDTSHEHHPSTPGMAANAVVQSFSWVEGTTPLASQTLVGTVVVSYVSGSLALRAWMKNKPPVSLGRIVPAAHNLVLCLWSLVMVIGVGIESMRETRARGGDASWMFCFPPDTKPRCVM